jgi:hypothetical protein
MGVSPGHLMLCPARAGNVDCVCPPGTFAPKPDRPPRPGTQVGGTHYEEMPIEPFTIIDAFGLDFYRGNALKYLLRAGRKPGQSEVQELEKAKDYLDQAIARVNR